MEKRKRKWGDRIDGYWVKDMDALHVIMPHIYNRRTEAEVYVLQEFDVTELLKYLAKQNKLHPEYKTTVFHALLFGIGKIIYHRPLLNRFISAGRTYQRYDIDVTFLAKKEFSDHSEEAMLKEIVQPDWTLNSLSEYIYNKVRQAKEGAENNTEDIMEVLAKMPRPLLSFVTWFLRKLSTYGKLPKSIWEGDVNYGTVLVTNLCSIKAPAVYHHLNEYGTASIIAAIGTIRQKPVYTAKGELKEHRDVVDIGITIDERIADGFYFARSLKIMDKMLADPKLFNEKIEEPINE